MSDISKDSSAVVIDDYLVSEQPSLEPSTQSGISSAVTRRLSVIMILASLFVLPLLFGGVHEPAFLSFRAATFLLVSALVLFEFPTLKSIFAESLSCGKGLRLLGLIFVIVLLHSVAFLFMSEPHPVLGSISKLFAPYSTANALIELAAFVGLFVITCFWLGRTPSTETGRPEQVLLGAIILAAFLISLVALSHWFYDNGKLFWSFSPDNEAISTRARWPFVNPNHLAIFLILPFFLTVGRIFDNIDKVRNSSKKLMRRGQIALSEVLGDRSTQQHSRSVIFLILAALTFTLAIIASLSRNAVFAAAVCLLAFLLLAPRKKSTSIAKKIPTSSTSTTPAFSSSEESSSGRRRRSSRRRQSEASNGTSFSIDVSKAIPILKFSLRLGIVLAILFTIRFFLGERGGELFSSRLEYALLYTRDDMRWQIYHDSLPMLWANPVFGIGLGNWLALYPQYMAEGLSGMNPGYLHSDILQIVVELGLLVSLVCLGSVIGIARLLRNTVKQDPHAAQHGTHMIRAAFWGFCAILLCCCFEFPLRIPAINSLIAIVLALVIFRGNGDQQDHPIK